MRENVAKVTDILVVIIAVDEGIKQQTEEVIKLGMSFEIPMLIALNKCDKHVDSREIEKIKMELSNMGVHLEDQGGDVQVVQLSAKTEKGLTDFQDAVLLLSEMLQPKARRDVPAEVMIIENRLDRMHGQLLFGLVQRGTLSKGNYVVVDKHHGQIVSLLDFQGKKINSATPGMPVFIKAFSSLPEPGKVLHVVSNAREAEKYVTDFATAKVDETSVEPSESSDSTIFNNQKPVLNLMVKADLAGSIQSIEDYVSRMPKDFVSARVLSSGIGNISEMDVEIAAESKSLIVGFNVGPHTNAKSAIKRYEGKVKVITSRIVYDLLSKINVKPLYCK